MAHRPRDRPVKFTGLRGDNPEIKNKKLEVTKSEPEKKDKHFPKEDIKNPLEIKSSICVSLKNRCKVKHAEGFLNLFPESLKSLAGLRDKDNIEVVIADFMSDDSVLEDWVFDLGLNVNLVKVEGNFSRGRGLNIAAANANYTNLLFTDADLLYDNTVIPKLTEVLSSGKSWFPIIHYIGNNGQLYWMSQNGQGICGVTKEVFEKSKKWPEFYSYGGEDHNFYYDIRSQTMEVREKFEGLQHQFHPNGCRYEHYIKPHATCYNESKRKK